MAEFWIESIGLVAGFIGIVAWIPQIRAFGSMKRGRDFSTNLHCRNSFTVPMACLWNHSQFHCHDRIEHLTLAFIIAITLGVYRIRNKPSEDELNKPTSSSE